MNDTRWNPEKPAVIIALCVIGLINAIQMINLVFSPMSKQVGALYPAYFAFSVALSLACIAGLWMLRRWAAFAYTVLLICNQLVLMKMGYWEITAAIIPGAIILLLFKHLDSLR